jgi:hypothetical protein
VYGSAWAWSQVTGFEEVRAVRINRGLLGWGLFLVLLGAVPLAVRAGAIPADLVGRAWQLWPLLLVAIGVAVVARGTPLEHLAGLAFPVVLGLMLGGALASGTFAIGGCSDDAGRSFEGQSGTFGSAAEVSIDLPCGELQVRAVAGSVWRVAGSDEDGGGPRIEADGDGLSVAGDRGFGFRDARPRWVVEVPTTPTVTLETRVNAGDGRLDLAGATLGEVELDVNAGSARLDLSIVNTFSGPLNVDINAGDATILLPNESLTGEVSTNAGSVVLCTPEGAGLRIETDDNVTATFDFAARGLVRSGDIWETPGFAGARVRIELRARANAGTIALDRQPECETDTPD